MSSNIVTENKEVEMDLDKWLLAPDSDSITIPAKEEAPKNIFSPRENNSLAFLNEEEDKVIVTNEELNEDGTVKIKGKTEKLDDILAELEPAEELEVEETKTESKKTGRPKTDKSALVDFLKKRIEAKEMVTFDDFDDENGDLDEYLTSLSAEDVDELWQANMDSIKTKVAEETPKEFYESLPIELQAAAKYAIDGGNDFKSLFKALAHVEETKELDPEDENDQESIVRGYLSATKFGDETEINEEIEEWKNLGTLEKKAKQFKPKLDNMQEEQVAAQLAEQEARKQQQQKAANEHVNNSFEALRTGELNGIKLDKKVQSSLYTGLVKPQYTSVNGRPTNLLGHLLEKYQLVEPNYPLIAEALWLLSNPDEYRENLVKTGKTAATEEITRKLKTESTRKTTSTNGVLEDKQINKVNKPIRQTNIFKR